MTPASLLQRQVKNRLAGDYFHTLPAQEHQATAFLVTEGDFDGDGRIDKAYFTGGSCQYPLGVTFATEETVTIIPSMPTIRYIGIQTADEGHYRANCADPQDFECSLDTPTHLALTDRQAIKLFKDEAFSTLLYWQDGVFKQFYLSD